MFPYFCRGEGGHWQQMMGESWEPVYCLEDELEQKYQENYAKILENN